MSFNVPSPSIQTSLFSDFKDQTTAQNLLEPSAYLGLAGFHKYWGKKPTESVSFLIEKLTDEGDLVIDPFLGSGLVSIECLSRGRRFVGIDINPFSIEHTSLLLSLPDPQEYYEALKQIEKEVAEEINETYRIHNGSIASHFLWEGDKIASIWVKPVNSRTRQEIEPKQEDMDRYLHYQNYQVKYLRNLIFYNNSRINVKPSLSLTEIFSGRALMNIEKIMGAAGRFSPLMKRALLLTLTSASGQMSNMVFAIKNRGGNGLANGSRIEVGSWVIGYWIPKTHFEINVWNCFKNRANKLLNALPNVQASYPYKMYRSIKATNFSSDKAILINDDCRDALRNMPDESVSLVCTDPPHSDRVPYLELSEIWNSILGYNPDFENEIVVSNAKERGKSKSVYNDNMTDFFLQTNRVLKAGGYIALFFNARDEESWKYLKDIETLSNGLKYIGCFPMVYSSTSIVQDCRKGAMKSDYILIYRKNGLPSARPFPLEINSIPGWSNHFPSK